MNKNTTAPKLTKDSTDAEISHWIYGPHRPSGQKLFDLIRDAVNDGYDSAGATR